MTICKQHPGGAKELPANAFYPSDQGRAFAPCKECRKTSKRIAPKPQQPAIAVTTLAVGGAAPTYRPACQPPARRASLARCDLRIQP